MRITILGTANAWGPNPFELNWNWEWLQGRLSTGELVRFRQYCTSLWVQSECGDSVVVDCGPDFCKQLWEFRIEHISAVLLTHSHWDHIGGLDYLYHYRSAPTMQKAKPRIPVYATKPCWEEVLASRGFQYLCTNGIIGRYDLVVGECTRLGSLAITPFQVLHGQTAPGAVGFLFEEENATQLRRVVYSGDFYDLVPPADGFFRREFDLVILECNQWQPRANGHISFQQIVELFRQGALAGSTTKQLTLVHFSEHGPEGATSSYDDWRSAALASLHQAGLARLLANPDHLIAYEGLTLP